MLLDGLGVACEGWLGPNDVAKGCSAGSPGVRAAWDSALALFPGPLAWLCWAGALPPIRFMLEKVGRWWKGGGVCTEAAGGCAWELL